MPPKHDRIPGFADRLKAYREITGFTIGEIADRIGANRSTVGHWETGHREPSLSKLVDLAAVLKVTTDRLLGVEKRKH